MVENTKVKSPTVKMMGPIVVKSENACFVSPAPLNPFIHSPELTNTNPVSAHIMTVSQNVPGRGHRPG